MMPLILNPTSPKEVLQAGSFGWLLSRHYVLSDKDHLQGRLEGVT